MRGQNSDYMEQKKKNDIHSVIIETVLLAGQMGFRSRAVKLYLCHEPEQMIKKTPLW